VLLREAEANISPGERVALVGHNGSGKTSLLSIFVGEQFPDGGSLEQPLRRVTRLEQGLPQGDDPAWRYLVLADPELTAARRALEHAEAQGEQADGLAIAHAHQAWLEAGGPSAEARAKALLHGLGFSEHDADRSVDELSGGWRMRLNLARALFSPCDLLLLDEPTNHLDLDAIVWLERWLARQDLTLIVVSHDRDFLDRVARVTLHIDEGKLVRYAGGYSEFERQRAERAAQAVARQATQAQRIADLERFINRFRAQANRARQVQSRIKALERIAQVAPIRALRGVDITLPPVDDCPDPLMRVQALSAGYNGKPVVSRVDLTVARGARIGVLGRNGAGKSTIIQTLVGELEALSGELVRARTLRIGYFAQEAVSDLRDEDSPLAHLSRKAPLAREQVLRDHLARFGFGGEDAMRPAGPMSGGEKARLVLALLLWDAPHLLVLDEPTNHLDAQTRDALAEALAQFEGALILVSHDRYLLRATVDQLMLIDAGQARLFDGDLDDYTSWLMKRPSALEAQAPATGPATESERASPLGSVPAQSAARTPVQEANGAERVGLAPSTDRRSERREAAQRRAELAALTRPIDQQISVLDRTLASLQQSLQSVDASLTDPNLYQAIDSGPRVANLSREQARLQRELAEAEERWLSLQMERESLLSRTMGA
jgi:ATP-binding cassette subfamily F protein 3